MTNIVDEKTKLEDCKQIIVELLRENEKLKEENQKLKIIAFAKETLDNSKWIGQLISEIKKTMVETEKSNVESIADFKDKKPIWRKWGRRKRA